MTVASIAFIRCSWVAAASVFTVFLACRFYLSHTLKDDYGCITCPILYSYTVSENFAMVRLFFFCFGIIYL